MNQTHGNSALSSRFNVPTCVQHIYQYGTELTAALGSLLVGFLYMVPYVYDLAVAFTKIIIIIGTLVMICDSLKI